MTTGRLLLGALVALVGIAIVAGLVISGSPQRQRELRLDEQRVSGLLRISNDLARHYAQTGSLPGDVEDVVDGLLLSSLPVDPVSGRNYEYTTTGAASYRLCADFARETDRSVSGEFWNHAAGRQCFDFDLSNRRLD